MSRPFRACRRDSQTQGVALGWLVGGPLALETGVVDGALGCAMAKYSPKATHRKMGAARRVAASRGGCRCSRGAPPPRPGRAGRLQRGAAPPFGNSAWRSRRRCGTASKSDKMLSKGVKMRFCGVERRFNGVKRRGGALSMGGNMVLSEFSGVSDGFGGVKSGFGSVGSCFNAGYFWSDCVKSGFIWTKRQWMREWRG